MREAFLTLLASFSSQGTKDRKLVNAAKLGRAREVGIMLRAGANPNSQEIGMDFPLIAAARSFRIALAGMDGNGIRKTFSMLWLFAI